MGVTRFGDLLDFEQLFKAFGDYYLVTLNYAPDHPLEHLSHIFTLLNETLTKERYLNAPKSHNFGVIVDGSECPGVDVIFKCSKSIAETTIILL